MSQLVRLEGKHTTQSAHCAVQCVTITPSYWYLVSLHSPRNDQPDSPAHPLPLTLTFARQLQWERDSWGAFYDHC